MARQAASEPERKREKRMRQKANTGRDRHRKTASQTVVQIHKTENKYTKSKQRKASQGHTDKQRMRQTDTQRD